MTITERLRERAYAWRNREAIARARRIAAASSANVAALRKAEYLLTDLANEIWQTDGDVKAYAQVESALRYIIRQLRDAHLWQEGAL